MCKFSAGYIATYPPQNKDSVSMGEGENRCWAGNLESPEELTLCQIVVLSSSSFWALLQFMGLLGCSHYFTKSSAGQTPWLI